MTLRTGTPRTDPWQSLSLDDGVFCRTQKLDFFVMEFRPHQAWRKAERGSRESEVAVGPLMSYTNNTCWQISDHVNRLLSARQCGCLCGPT